MNRTISKSFLLGFTLQTLYNKQNYRFKSTTNKIIGFSLMHVYRVIKIKFTFHYTYIVVKVTRDIKDLYILNNNA